MPKAQSVQCYRWSFTIQAPGAVGEQDLPEVKVVKSWLSSVGVKKWIFQLERGEEEGRLHYQGQLQLESKKRKRQLLTSTGELFPENYLTLSPTSKNGSASAWSYAMKEDTRVKGPWGDRPIYLGQDLVCMNSPFPWQQQVLDTLKTEPNDRTIQWVWEREGNVGKSKLVKFLRWKKLATNIPAGTATQIKTSVISKGPAKAYMLDMPRTKGKDEHMEDLFSAIEQIKNGMVESAMYGKNQELLMEPPHIFCFANYPPPMECLSADRWKVFKVVNRALVTWEKRVL